MDIPPRRSNGHSKVCLLVAVSAHFFVYQRKGGINVLSPSDRHDHRPGRPGWLCGKGATTQPQPLGLNGKPVDGRCGPGTRIPFLVVSPWAKTNYISHTLISQASVVRFIEDNWLHGQRIGAGSFDATAGSIMNMFDFHRKSPAGPLLLDASTGQPTDG